MSLFDIVSSAPASVVNWVPQEPPSLDGVRDIELDCETNGLKWWRGDRPIGISVAFPDGHTQYLPWGHKAGGNLDEATVKRWAQRELRGKRITNLNTRFDVHMMREWGVDLEEQGCDVSDVGHYAALLDDHRQRFSLEAIVGDMLEGEEKVKVVNGIELDGTRMAEYHAGIVAVRAEADVRQVQKLKRLMWPKLDAEGLQRVRQLEDDVIYTVCEMEKNGAKVDVALLDLWLKRSLDELNELLRSVSADAGLQYQTELFEGGKDSKLLNPDSANDMERLFTRLRLPIARTATGRPSFTKIILKSLDHPTIAKVIRASQLIDLRSKYLLPYERSVNRSTGIVRYALNQLKAQKDPWSEESKGTVSGRFSGSKLTDDEGITIQGVIKTAKQRVAMGFDEEDASHDDEIYPIRQLHIPESGLHLSADAMQIEYRIFAAKTKSKRLIDIYKGEPKQNERGDWIQGPLASFHRVVHGMLKPYKPSLTYRRQKDLNFAKIYGAGLRKMALMMEFVDQEQYFALLDDKNWKKSPLLKEVIEINAIYNREIPEAGPLLDRARRLAEDRGYVKTVLGRRSRFPFKQRSHKALNAVIQGSAADDMKLKLVELHRERKHTGLLLRYTVHDEVDGDARNGQQTADRVAEILNRQSIPLEVPILWEVSTGDNWKECQ